MSMMYMCSVLLLSYVEMYCRLYMNNDSIPFSLVFNIEANVYFSTSCGLHENIKNVNQ